MNPGDKEAEKKFKEASEAYAVLSDADKRRQYDQFGHAAFEEVPEVQVDLAADLMELILETFSEISLEICSEVPEEAEQVMAR